MTELYPTVETLSEVECDTHELEELPVSVPRYAAFHTPVVTTGKKGRGPGELYWASGVAIHEDTHQILVANYHNDRVEIFSEMGEFLYQLGVGQLSSPSGIATHGDSVYISCLGDHTVSKFSLTEMYLVRSIGSEGPDNGQFNNPRQLTADPFGRVFIADTDNNRICIHDTDLKHLHNILHESTAGTCDVKISRDRLYVLCPEIEQCMHVFTLDGDKLHSLIFCGRGCDVSFPTFFCLDHLNNLVISNSDYHSICVFSPEGNLLQVIGRSGDQPGMFSIPSGVAITPNRRLVCVSSNVEYGLQIFC